MKPTLPIFLSLFCLIAPVGRATDTWSCGIGLHEGVWLHSQAATSHWTVQDQSGYLLSLTQQEGANSQSPVLYLRNTISWQNALVDGIVRYSVNRSAASLHGLYLGFGPRVAKSWGSVYLNLGGVFAVGSYNAKVEQTPSAPAEGFPAAGESVAVSFLGLVPAMEGGLDFQIGKLGINLAYSLIGQRKLNSYHCSYQGEPIALQQLDGYVAPITVGGSFLSCSVSYHF